MLLVCLRLRTTFCLRGYGCLLLMGGLFDMYDLLCLLVNLCWVGFVMFADVAL